MLKVRLQRVGRKNNPSFRVVVVDSKRGPKSGDYIEMVGSHNPRTKETQIKSDRIQYWLSVGAQVSPTVHNMLIREKVIEGKMINVLPKKSPIVKEAETNDKEEAKSSTEDSSNNEEVKVQEGEVEKEAESDAPVEENTNVPATPQSEESQKRD